MNRRLNKLIKDYEKFSSSIVNLSNDINYFDSFRFYLNLKNDTIWDIKSFVDDEVYKLFRSKNYGICNNFYSDLFQSYKVMSINFDGDSISFDGLIDYELVRDMVISDKPDILLIGSCCYPRFIDYKRLSDIAVNNGCKFLVDISNIFDLVINGYVDSPFLYADGVVCKLNYLDKFFIISNSYIEEWNFDNNDLINLACWLTGLDDDSYKFCVDNIVNNMKVMVKCLVDNGIKLVTDGADNGIILIDKINFKNSVKDTINLLYKNGILVSENNSGIVLNLRNESFKGKFGEEFCDIGCKISKLIKEE